MLMCIWLAAGLNVDVHLVGRSFLHAVCRTRRAYHRAPVAVLPYTLSHWFTRFPLLNSLLGYCFSRGRVSAARAGAFRVYKMSHYPILDHKLNTSCHCCSHPLCDPTCIFSAVFTPLTPMFDCPSRVTDLGFCLLAPLHCLSTIYIRFLVLPDEHL